MAYLTKTYGVPKSAYGNFSVHHLGGERYEVVGRATTWASHTRRCARSTRTA
ncbi:MAG: hypothetical protein Q8L54_08780 [Devosia sp.]|nr:hypothetical protein [Devosia sp.]